MALQHKIIILSLLSQSFLCSGMDKPNLELALQDIRSFGTNAQATCQASAQRTNYSFEQEYKKQQNSKLKLTQKQNIPNQNFLIIEQTKRFKESFQQKDEIVDLTAIFPEDMKKLADVKKVNFAANFKKDINPELHYLASALDANINKKHSLLEKCYFLAAIGAGNKTKLNFHDLSHALDASNKNDIRVDLGTIRSPLELENENDYTKYIAAYTRIRDEYYVNRMASTCKVNNNNKKAFHSPVQTNASSSTTENNWKDRLQTRKRKPQPNSNINSYKNILDYRVTEYRSTPDSSINTNASSDTKQLPSTQLKKEKNTTITTPVNNPRIKQLSDEPNNYEKCLRLTAAWAGTSLVIYPLVTIVYAVLGLK